MRNVIVFDDHMATYKLVADCFDEINDPNGSLLYCQTINEANRIIDETQSECLLILDIMMPSRGLSDELRAKTDGNKITGWIWLWEYQKMIKHNTGLGASNLLIYSAYLDDLEQHISALDPQSDERAFYNKLIKIEKGEMSGLENVKNSIAAYFTK